MEYRSGLSSASIRTLIDLRGFLPSCSNKISIRILFCIDQDSDRTILRFWSIFDFLNSTGASRLFLILLVDGPLGWAWLNGPKNASYSELFAYISVVWSENPHFTSHFSFHLTFFSKVLPFEGDFRRPKPPQLLHSQVFLGFKPSTEAY